MKRYLVFAGDDYYPAGGWGDFQGSFDSAVDIETGEWVEHGGPVRA
jgi:hypothetical protein